MHIYNSQHKRSALKLVPMLIATGCNTLLLIALASEFKISYFLTTFSHRVEYMTLVTSVLSMYLLI